MRVQGHNVLAILVAAIVMYGIGAAVYGWLFADVWMQLSGFSKDDFAGLEWKMYLSPVMPILLAIGLSLANKWRGAIGIGGGAATGFLTALFFVFATTLYPFVYGTGPVLLLGIDALHLFSIMIVGGAILGAWK